MYRLTKYIYMLIHIEQCNRMCNFHSKLVWSRIFFLFVNQIFCVCVYALYTLVSIVTYNICMVCRYSYIFRQRDREREYKREREREQERERESKRESESERDI